MLILISDAYVYVFLQSVISLTIAINAVYQSFAQSGLPDKGRTIKGLVVCCVVYLESMIYGMGLWTSARCVDLVPCCCQDGYRA